MAILRVWDPVLDEWIAIPYIKGDKGDRGYGVSSVIFEYYSSTSNSSQTGGEWTTVLPGIASGRYIWIREKTTNENGDVYTSEPMLAALFNDTNDAELSRRTNENSRNAAEELRASAETNRNTSESNRVSAENERASAESNRLLSETSRNNAESQRVSAESARASAETNRSAAENQRVLNEQARLAAQDRFPIVQNDNWWVWDGDTAQYVDTGEPARGPRGYKGETGDVYYATFDLDPETGILYMTTPSGYTGPDFVLTDEGILEVIINE